MHQAACKGSSSADPSGPGLSISGQAQKPAADLEESMTLRSMVKDWWPCELSHPTTDSC